MCGNGHLYVVFYCDVFYLGGCMCSSTNLSELAKAVRLLAALHPTQPTGDELLKAAQALAGATAGLLSAAQPENMEVSCF